ncbi:hypothetical protein CTEN210_08102 [Chaetoceros tenuissimus]|uniref:Serine aminopeptidase S33 domain-containing protein n=1 Tax=Chaetoceros tenuissimus TaxID=426638 RepID=A0AAD3CSY5_9STRA|nr:hypothetical protein CTEN210_08102 [Chaetoceros tenuissimus]
MSDECDRANFNIGPVLSLDYHTSWYIVSQKAMIESKTLFILLLICQYYGLAFGFSNPQRAIKQTIKHEFQNRHSKVEFINPLIESGYPPTVKEYKANKLNEKPLLLYLPGFDGTLLSPFLQFPALSEEFDVRGLEIAMDDRSSLEDLQNMVLNFLQTEAVENRPVYLMGESFGGILTMEVVLKIQEEKRINLEGICLINPATCYDVSNLAEQGPPVTKVPAWRYPFKLMKLLPLFVDDYGFKQFTMILKSEGLPSVIDNEQREAYMGRCAFTIPQKLQFMPQDTLKHRLGEWLTKGCASLKSKEDSLRELDLDMLIIVGEVDNTLPSMEEKDRLVNIFKKSKVSTHVVKGSGHANTVGSRCDLVALMRDAFYEKLDTDGRREMKATAQGEGDFFGMEPRYDGASIGLMPTEYWSESNFQRIHE